MASPCTYDHKSLIKHAKTASSSGALRSVASRRARRTRNWGRERERSREGERREVKRLQENVSISWQFCRFLVMVLFQSF